MNRQFIIRTILLTSFLGILTLHIAAIVGYVPAEFVWGGRLESQNQIRTFETISPICVTVFFSVIAIRLNIFNTPTAWHQIAQKILWLFFVVFVANTVGNLFAHSSLEKFFATPVTALLAAVSYL